MVPLPTGSSHSPTMLAMLPSNSTSAMKSGIAFPCSARVTLGDPELLLMKVIWITSLGRVESQ